MKFFVQRSYQVPQVNLLRRPETQGFQQRRRLRYTQRKQTFDSGIEGGEPIIVSNHKTKKFQNY